MHYFDVPSQMIGAAKGPSNRSVADRKSWGVENIPIALRLVARVSVLHDRFGRNGRILRVLGSGSRAESRHMATLTAVS